MKRFIFLSLLLASQFTLAGVLPEEEGKLVIRAVVDSLTDSQLNCRIQIDDQVTTKPLNQSLKLSVLTGENENVKQVVSIDDEERQPIITITRTFSNSTEEIFKLTTNTEVTEVIEIDFVDNEVKKVTRNVGTLTKPKYEEVETRKELASVYCK